MTTRLKALLITVGLWLAQRGGWTPCAVPHLPSDDHVALAKAVVADVQARFGHTSGEFRRREALRVLLNLRPEAATRDLNLLIEVALR